MMPIPKLPESTYRVQFHAGFTFRDATAIVPYLASLGVTHLYASPYLKARAGSTHGYDIIDHCSLNPELGDEADFEALLAALADHQMSHILDVVPNHVGVATNDNKWWNDVLANGPDSKYGRFFDIDWEGSPRPELHGKVLLPLLGGAYAEVLEKGELKLSHDQQGFWVNYHERRFPISPATLPARPGDDPATMLRRLNGVPGNARSFDALHDLLERQFYRLAYWKNASDEINYRRFFDINDLAALAMEREDVFAATHQLIFKLIAEGKISGLRVDHPDGLYDPAAYFKRLQDTYRDRVGGGGDKPLYLLAEKILAIDEALPTEWQIHGTSGYDFLNMVNGLFIKSENADAFSAVYREWLKDDLCSATTEFDDLVYIKKKLILEMSLASELHVLSHRLDRLAQRHRGWRDFSLAALTKGLRETIACFGVYRTYINGPDVSQRDVRVVEQAISEAIRRNPSLDAALFHFIRDALLQRYPDTFTHEDRAAQLKFAGRFQQLTSPTTAKGIEDTSFYIYNRFVSLNEVGGEPSHFGTTPDRLHQYLQDRQVHWPHAMSALSTHDTKRSDDVRARLNVLSEVPTEWRAAVIRWRSINDRHKTLLKGSPAPDANDEYLIYQSLLGAWPLEPWSASEYDAFGDRMKAYVIKAMREAKVHTAWTSPNTAYEEAATTFVGRLLDRTSGGEFLDDFARLRKRISRLGLLNSLSQTLLRLSAPGVPDTYQGTELWDFSLVDPDNRRPVDYGRRVRHLGEIKQSSRDPSFARQLLETLEQGAAKLFLHQELLRLRRTHPSLLTSGQYVPLQITGEKASHVFAFLRRHGSRTLLVAVPRLVVELAGNDDGMPLGDAVWGDTRILLPETLPILRNLFTGQQVEADRSAIGVGGLFQHFPLVAAFAE